MQPYHEIKSYSEQVVSNIRWKKARAMIATEIENHLCDQRDAYRKLGDDLDTATKKSIEQMGDPIFLGKELDKAHRPNSQLLSILFIGVLLSLGLVIQSALCSISNTTSTISILSYIIAFGLCVCCYYIDIFHLLHHAKFLYLFALVVSVFALFIATPVRGVRMISFSGITTSLSFLSLVFPIIYAAFLYSMRSQGLRGLILSALAYFPPALILLAIPTISGWILYTVSTLILLSLCVKHSWFGFIKSPKSAAALMGFVLAVCTIGLAVSIHSYSTIQAFFFPQQDPYNGGLASLLLQEVLRNSVLLGKGYPLQQLETIATLPGIQSNYSLVYLIYQFGFLAFGGIVLLTLLFCAWCIYKVYKQKSFLGALLSTAVFMPFVLQIFFACTAAVGYLPSSSFSFPFFSYGSTALFLNAALLGFMLSIFRDNEILATYSISTH